MYSRAVVSNVNVLVIRLIATLSILLIGTVSVSADILYVPDNSTSIQGVVSSASSGDIIIVESGIYYESVTITKDNITLKGNDSGRGLPVIFGMGFDPDYTVLLAGNKSTIQDFAIRSNKTNADAILVISNNNTIKRCDVSDWGFVDGIYLLSSNDNLIMDNIVNKHSHKNGIYLESSHNNSIINNTFKSNVKGLVLHSSHSNFISGNKAEDNTQHGIYLEESSTNNNVTGNFIDNNGDNGIYILNSDNNFITGNEIYNSSSGVFSEDSIGNQISENEIAGNSYAIKAKNSNGLTVSGNEIKENTLFGIFMENSDSAEINNNRVSENANGIYFDHASFCTVKKNTVFNNTYNGAGITLSTDNTFSENNFSSNSIGMLLAASDKNKVFFNTFKNSENVNITSSVNGSFNVWNSSSSLFYKYNDSTFKEVMGNYWDNFNASDNDSDGIWDVPYNISGNSAVVGNTSAEIDFFPLVRPVESYELVLKYQVSGNLTVNGTWSSGLATVRVYLNDSGDPDPIEGPTSFAVPGPYSFSLPNGEYLIDAFIDTGNGTPDINEPYGSVSVEVNGSAVSNANIGLFIDEEKPIPVLNAPLYTFIHYNASSLTYANTTVDIDFNITDNVKVKNGTLEVWNGTAWFYNLSLSDNGSVSVNISNPVPGTYLARLSTYDVWENFNVTEFAFYLIGTSSANVVSDLNNSTEFKILPFINISVIGNGSIDITLEESPVNSTFAVPSLTAFKYFNLTGKASGNITGLELIMKGDYPVYFWDNKTNWEDISSLSCTRYGEGKTIVNLTVLASLKNMNLSQLLADPIFVPLEAPDLIVQKLNLPENPVMDNPYTISITVGNIGNYGAENITVSLIIDGSEFDRKIISLLNPGTEDAVDFGWRPPSSKNYKIRAEIDPGDEIPELNDNNNTESKEIQVSSPAPPSGGGGGGGGGPLPTPNPTQTSTPSTVKTPSRVNIPSIPMIPMTTPTPEGNETDGGITPTPDLTPSPEPTKTPEWWAQPTGSIAISAIVFSALVVVGYFIKRKS